MPRRFLIIDGYNLMHAAGLARRTYAPGQLQRCRTQLLRYLASHLAAPERERTTVVFDAGEAPPDLPRQTMAAGMRVCFASPGKEADDTIEELIAAHSSPRQIRLVSSDHRLQRSARRRRGEFVDSEVFAAELEHRGPVAETDPDAVDAEAGVGSKERPDPAMDVEAWLAIFGGITEATELATGAAHGTAPIDQSDVAALKDEIDRAGSADVPRAKRPPGKPGKRRRSR
jgi:uncharacterized protein